MTPLSFPLTNHLHLIIDNHSFVSQTLQLIAALCHTSQVTLIDCGNRAQMYTVAKHLRSYTNDPVSAMRNIRLSRAFTCYQVHKRLSTLQPQDNHPVIIMDMLTTFYDDEVKPAEANWLLLQSIAYILDISEKSPVLITTRATPAMAKEKSNLLQLLRQVSSVYETPEPAIAIHPKQLSLLWT